MRRRFGRLPIAMIMLSLVAAACAVETSVPSTSTSSSTTSVVETTTTIPPTSTTTSLPTTTTELRGDPVEGGPQRGAVLAVVGVAHDDVLNLRAAPGADQPILAGIPPTYEEIVALGETRSLPAWWVKVVYEDTVGWVNLSFLAFIGATSDVTAAILDQLGGSLEAATMTELGAEVAAAAASDDPPSDIVVVVDETVGDLGEITYDVIGLGDDSVAGVRLHIFGEPTTGGFSLRTVEMTALCQPVRGVDDDGLCV